MRRVHVKGILYLYDYSFDFNQPEGNFTSGGFIADSVVDTKASTPAPKYVFPLWSFCLLSLLCLLPRSEMVPGVSRCV